MRHVDSSRPGTPSNVVGFVDIEQPQQFSVVENTSLNNSVLTNQIAQQAQANEWMKQRIHRKTREL